MAWDWGPCLCSPPRTAVASSRLGRKSHPLLGPPQPQLAGTPPTPNPPEGLAGGLEASASPRPQLPAELEQVGPIGRDLETRGGRPLAHRSTRDLPSRLAQSCYRPLLLAGGCHATAATAAHTVHPRLAGEAGGAGPQGKGTGKLAKHQAPGHRGLAEIPPLPGAEGTFRKRGLAPPAQTSPYSRPLLCTRRSLGP